VISDVCTNSHGKNAPYHRAEQHLPEQLTMFCKHSVKLFLATEKKDKPNLIRNS